MAPAPRQRVANTLHPAQRLVAPATMQRGVPLKELLGGRLVDLIGESLIAVQPDFNQTGFRARARRGLNGLELKDRARHIAQALAEHLPSEFAAAAAVLIRSFGPPLTATSGNGLAPFFYLPHGQFIASQGTAHFASGMQANYELTQRFTAEFSIRPFLKKHRAKSLALLERWTRDANPHVRRLVSEGTRPRLPWAERLPEFQHDPHLALPLLERLKDDPELYVRRSVANHLGDIAKDHLRLVCDVCEAWLTEVERPGPTGRAAARCALVQHALRYPAKRGDAQALALRARAAVLRKSRNSPAPTSRR